MDLVDPMPHAVGSTVEQSHQTHAGSISIIVFVQSMLDCQKADALFLSLTPVLQMNFLQLKSDHYLTH